MCASGGDGTQGTKGPQGFRLSGREHRPGGPGPQHPVAGRQAWVGTRVPACPRRPLPSPPRDKPLRSLGSPPRPQCAALTSAGHAHTGRGAGAQGHAAARCHVCQGLGAAPTPAGSVAVTAPPPADEGAGRRAAWTRRKQDVAGKRASGRGAPRFPLLAPAVPRDPPLTERGVDGDQNGPAR